MSKGKDWKEVLKEYRVKVKAGRTTQKACVTQAMAKTITKPVGACSTFIGAPRIITGKRISSNVIRSRTV